MAENPWKQRTKLAAKARMNLVILVLTYATFILGAFNNLLWHNQGYATYAFWMAVAVSILTVVIFVSFLVMLLIIYNNRRSPDLREKFDIGVDLHFGKTTIWGCVKDTRIPILFALCGFTRMAILLLIVSIFARVIFVSFKALTFGKPESV